MSVILTAKTRAVLREMFNKPTAERPAAEIGKAAQLDANVTASLLARLINMGFVTDRRVLGVRHYRLVPKNIVAAAEAADVRVPRRASSSPASVRASAEAEPGVWRVSDLRAAAERGEVSADFLEVVEREVAKTVKKTTQT